jgi:hypothetical protein
MSDKPIPQDLRELHQAAKALSFCIERDYRHARPDLENKFNEAVFDFNILERWACDGASNSEESTTIARLIERIARAESDLSALRGKVESATEIMAEIVRIDDQGDSPRWDWWAPKMRELLAARAAEGGTHGK